MEVIGTRLLKGDYQHLGMTKMQWLVYYQNRKDQQNIYPEQEQESRKQNLRLKYWDIERTGECRKNK